MKSTLWGVERLLACPRGRGWSWRKARRQTSCSSPRQHPWFLHHWGHGLKKPLSLSMKSLLTACCSGPFAACTLPPSFAGLLSSPQSLNVSTSPGAAWTLLLSLYTPPLKEPHCDCGFSYHWTQMCQASPRCSKSAHPKDLLETDIIHVGKVLDSTYPDPSSWLLYQSYYQFHLLSQNLGVILDKLLLSCYTYV